MQKHTKVYLRHFDYGEQDYIPCECCGRPSVDIHHLEGRGPGKDVIENLMALCRRCHEKAHSGEFTKGALQYIHNHTLLGHSKHFVK